MASTWTAPGNDALAGFARNTSFERGQVTIP
jgi:hypothetical protein